MTALTLVTGATGTVGRHVVDELADRPGTVRAGVRDPDSAAETVAEATEVVEFDFERPETWGDALAGVERVFLLRPPVVDTDAVTSFVDALGRVDAKRVAYLSTLGADRNVLVPHHRIEKHLVATDVEHVLLRASFFMQNLLEVHREDVVERDEIFVPAGDGETSFVDARDVAAVAAVVLTEDGHVDRAYDVTGPEALSYADVAAIFTDVLDRRIRYPSPSLPAFARRMWRRGHPLGFVVLTCGIYTTARLGLADRVSDDARRVLDRQPRGMRDFVEDYADQF
jgi:uncharacterized protein YbjT (DUF2867 family)